MTRGIKQLPPGTSSTKHYLMRFIDGAARGDKVVEWPWPLPDEIVFFPETQTYVDRKGEPPGGFPTDMGLVYYRKVAESQLPREADANARVMRGAQYQEVRP